MASVPS